ncbi:MAG: DUF4124 domain-containing protein [Proteobacteria bacterium]|nr:DUF4124 domain-containing protein [Pseudomonadota bacterium]
MKTLAFVALLAAMFLAASPAYAQVHKCKDVAGKTIYSDAPCAVGTRGRQINVQPNTIDTRMDWERSERYIRSRQQENELRRPSAAQPSAPEQQANEKRDSYACKMAIRNAETQSTSASPTKIDSDRGEARRICGFNPWPGPSASEVDAANRRTQAIERQTRDANRPRICNSIGGGMSVCN